MAESDSKEERKEAFLAGLGQTRGLVDRFMGVPKYEPEEKKEGEFPSFEEFYADRKLGLGGFGIYAGCLYLWGPLGLIPGAILRSLLGGAKDYLKGQKVSYTDLGLKSTENEAGELETEVTKTKGTDPYSWGKNFAKQVKTPRDYWNQFTRAAAKA